MTYKSKKSQKPDDWNPAEFAFGVLEGHKALDADEEQDDEDDNEEDD